MVLGFAWWACTGDHSLALPLALFFELFWLDLIPIGSFIPPMPAFPYLIVLSLAGIFGWTGPVTIAFPLVLSLPLAYLVPNMESSQRKLQIGAYCKLLTQAKKKLPLGNLPARLLAVSALQQILLGQALFILVAASLYALFSVPWIHDIFLLPLNVGWPVLYAIAAIGALLALRIRRAYLVFILSMAAMLVLQAF